MVSLTIAAALFCTLTTHVESHTLTWYFSLGFMKKSFDLDEIQSYKVVRNKAWWGIGIRLIPGGWLYCVSGLNAIELTLKNGKLIRVGTDEAVELAEAIGHAKGHC